MESSTSGDAVGGPAAEFAALRQEITTRITIQQSIFALQLSTAGAVFALVLADWSRAPILFVLPVTTYLFAGSYLTLHRVMRQMADYIVHELSPRVAGGLGWEEWVEHQNQEKPPPKDIVPPLYLAFPGVSALALALVVPDMFFGTKSVPHRISLVFAWLATAILAVLTVRLAKIISADPTGEDRPGGPGNTEAYPSSRAK